MSLILVNLHVNLRFRVARDSQIPRFSQDVLTLYGLQPLVASIARTDPVTGEKINKLRKSYENHLKAFCLAGRNKGIKEATPEKRLMYLANWPEEEFYNQRVAGKDVRHGLPNATLEKLGKAMHMQAGPVQDNNKWEDLLGLGIIKPIDAATDKKRKMVNTVAQPDVQVNGSRADISRTLDTGDTRPKRVAKRRKYDETTYEGYAEGYGTLKELIPILERSTVAVFIVTNKVISLRTSVLHIGIPFF